LTGTVIETVPETSRTKTISLRMPQWLGHDSGQHVDVRLTAPDGYQAERSYSIASAPEDEHVAITVERLDDGEVSPYLVDELRKGDELELRGPIGGYFVWHGDDARPLMLIAGGSGVVPFRSMLRHHRHIQSSVPVRLLYSARSFAELIYQEELFRLATSDEMDICLALTRHQPPGWQGYARRIDRDMLRETGWDPADRPSIYICGPTPFVETAANLLLASGHDAAAIRTERFGGIGQNS
jgi:ferredoxin-NADP reductase